MQCIFLSYLVYAHIYVQSSKTAYRHENQVYSYSSGKMTLVGLFPIHMEADKTCRTVLTTKNYNGFQAS